MWPTLFILALLAALGVHLTWRRRSRHWDELHRQHGEERRALQAQHEQEIRRINAQQAALFDGMVQGVLVLDRAGRIQMVNGALKRLFDQTTDPRGQTLIEALRQHEIEDIAERCRQANAPIVQELQRPGPPLRHLEVTATAIADASGSTPTLLLLFHDVTRLRQLEETRREFVANVSHELRTPLSMITGYVETLLDGAKDDPAVLPRFLETVQRHAQRLTFLIDDLLTISQVESGTLAMQRQSLDLAAAVAEVLEDQTVRAADRGVHLTSEVVAGLRAHADPDRLRQVLSNLVDNAIKYGRPEGSVKVRAEPAAEGWVKVQVEDNGPGVPPEALPRLFERFYRVDRARSREQGGTGLGLAIVKHIVQSHGGEVGVWSEQGRGTTFSFTLPSAEAGDAEPLLG